MRQLFGAVVLLVLGGCGDPKPQLYRVAINPATLRSVPGSCYNSGTVPDDLDNSNRLVEQEWTLWHGADEQSNYLQLPAQVWNLGSLVVNLPAATVMGGPTDWALTVSNVGGGNTEEESVTITFESPPGSTGEGSFRVRENNSNTANFRSCDATLPFFARLIPIDESTRVITD